MLATPYPHKQLVSFFKGNIYQSKPTSKINPKTVGLLVKYGFKVRTNLLRGLLSGSAEQKRCKLGLPYVVPAGTFINRTNAGLLTRSGYIVLDFDNLDTLESPRKLRRQLLKDLKLAPSIVLAYISPRGYGLKVWVAVDPSFDHKRCYEVVVAHVQEKYPDWCKNGKLDITPDISRGCLLCNDPSVYINEGYATAPAFPMPAEEWGDIFDDSGDRKTLDITREINLDTLERCVSAVEQVPGFADERNMWRDLGFAFASIGEQGRAYFHRVSRTSTQYSKQENDKLFNYCLEKHNGSISLGKFFYYCKEAGIDSALVKRTILPAGERALPALPAELYAQLPTFLQKCCSPFEISHERDTMLSSTLSIISGCMPSVGGTYAQRAYGLNLFVFIIGPAASGKGTMIWAKRLAQPYHKRLIEQSAVAWEAYETELAVHKAASKKEGHQLSTPPRPPARRLLYIPGNSTAAALIRILAENKGYGIICETEADTVSNAIRSEHGGFSDILRSIFQHEAVTMSRQTDRVHIDLERPALSIVLTGTPGQLQRLIPSAEDGFASRFLCYKFDQTPVWKDVSPAAGLPLDPHFDSLAKELDELLGALPEANENTTYPVTITLTSADWARVNTSGELGLREAWQEGGDAGASTAKRLGLIAWRIIGILTVLRHHERGIALKGELVADSIDVSTALTIMDTFRAHALAVLDSLSAPSAKRTVNKFEEKTAKRNEAVALRAQGRSLGEIAKQLNVSKSTVQGWCP